MKHHVRKCKKTVYLWLIGGCCIAAAIITIASVYRSSLPDLAYTVVSDSIYARYTGSDSMRKVTLFSRADTARAAVRIAERAWWLEGIDYSSDNHRPYDIEYDQNAEIWIIQNGLPVIEDENVIVSRLGGFVAIVDKNTGRVAAHRWK